MGKTYAQMLAAQKAANQKKYPPIETSGEYATNIAVQEGASPMQRALGATSAPADATRMATPEVDEEYANTPAEDSDEPESVDNPDEESEENVIARAFKSLGDRLREAAPHIDFKAEYAKLLEENKKPERRNLSPLHAFALSLGGGSEAVDRAERKVNESNDENENRFRELLGYKEQALKGQIQQMLEQGKFKQALVQSEELAKMNAVLDRIKGTREHNQAMELEGKRNEGRVAVANIRADKAREALQSRLNSLATTYKLEGQVRLAFFKAMFNAFAQRATMQDITGNPALSSDDFVKLLQQAEDWAEANSGEDLSTPPARPSSLGTPSAAPAAPSTTPATETDEQRALREIRQSKR